MSTSAPLLPDAVQPAGRAAWRAWLARHHAKSIGVWLVDGPTSL